MITSGPGAPAARAPRHERLAEASGLRRHRRWLSALEGYWPFAHHLPFDDERKDRGKRPKSIKSKSRLSAPFVTLVGRPPDR